MKTLKNFLSFKLMYRAAWILFWSLTYFVSPLFLFCLIFYGAMRFVMAMSGDFAYSQWKQINYGKSDKKLTHRKLLYLISKMEDLRINSADTRKNYNNKITHAGFKLDRDLKVKLMHKDESWFTYQSTLTFECDTIASTKGFAFTRVKWKLDDMPELKKAVIKYFEKIEEEIELSETRRKKATFKNQKEEEKRKEERRKELAKRTREIYKKKSTI